MRPPAPVQQASSCTKTGVMVEFTQENVAEVPELEGAYQLLYEQQNIIYIKGAMNVHQELEEQ